MTNENLKKAFAGESQASRKYAAFAEKAAEEGKKNVERLFKAASYSETIHARKHLTVMGGIRDTVANLKEAIAGENSEHTKMYPQFIEEAEREGNADAALSFRYANEAEKAHEAYFAEALAAVEAGQDMADVDIWVCDGCGYTMKGEAPERCPVCGAPKTMFTKF